MHRARESYCGRLVEGEPMRLDWSPLCVRFSPNLRPESSRRSLRPSFTRRMADTVAEAGAELARLAAVLLEPPGIWPIRNAGDF